VSAGVGLERRAEAWAAIMAHGGELAPEPEPEPKPRGVPLWVRRAVAWCACAPAAVVLLCSLVAVVAARWAEEWCAMVEAVCLPEWPADRETWWERAAGWILGLGDGGCGDGEAEDK